MAKDNSLGIDPKKFKHVKSDDKSTTLQHKDGHTLVIAHNVLAPKMKEQLMALAKAPKMANGGMSENSSDTPLMANGGEAPRWDSVTASRPANPAAGDVSAPGFKDKTTSEQDTQRHVSQDEAESNYKKANPTPAEPKEDNSGYSNYAEGGMLEQQGKDVRYSNKLKSKGDHKEAKQQMHYAKEEAKGRAQFEREAVKPNLKGLSHGGPIGESSACFACGGPARKMYADPDEVVSQDDPTPIQIPMKPDYSDRKTAHFYTNHDSSNSSNNAPQDDQVEAAPNSVDEADMTPIQPEQVPSDTGVSDDEIKQAAGDLSSQGQQPDQQQASAAPPQAPPEQQDQPVSPPQPGMPLDARQQSIYQVLHAKGTADQRQENVKFAQDIQNGHITPKTYSDLFQDKSTIGKIGMLFGMLVSGAGSGLTHQPNAVLEMMNKQIANDLEAQKTSKTNANNFVKLNVENELNQAQTKLVGSQANLSKEQADLVKQNAIGAGYANAHIQALTAAMDSQQKIVDKMPEGPQKQAAQQILGQIYAQAGNQIQNSTNIIAGAKAYNDLLFGSAGAQPGGNSAASDDASFQQRQQALLKLNTPQSKAMYDVNEAKHIPGVPGQASRPVPEDIRQRLQAQTILDNKGKDVLSYVKQHTGTWNPQTRAVAAQKIEEMKNFYNDSIKGGALTQGRLGWYDEQFAKHPTDILAQVMGSTAKLNEMVNSNRNRRDLELKGLGFPTQQPAPEYKTDKNGVKWMRGPNGEAIRVK
jgi:hypothetical protein